MYFIIKIFIFTLFVFGFSGCGSTISSPTSENGNTLLEENTTTNTVDTNTNSANEEVDNLFFSSENTQAKNYVQGLSSDQTAYLFDGTNVESSPNMGSISDLSLSMDIYIDDLKEAKTVLLDSGLAQGNIKLSIIDNQSSTFKGKDVALAFEVVGNIETKVETKYRRFMEHELEYLKTNNHERKANQLWINLALTYNVAQNKVDFYINGIYDSSQYFSTSTEAIINTLSLGSDLAQNHKFYGKMSNVKVERKILTSDEIYARADFRKNLWAEKYENSWTASRYYYVDSVNGDDNNDASLSSPLKTLTSAIAKVENLSNADAIGTHHSQSRNIS